MGEELDDIAPQAADDALVAVLRKLDEFGWASRFRAGQTELLSAVGHSINDCLREHQREVLVALTIRGVPLDALTERLGTTRGALYKTLHDARRDLRADLARRGFSLDESEGD